MIEAPAPGARPIVSCVLLSFGATLVVYGVGAVLFLFGVLVALNEVKGSITTVVIVGYLILMALANAALVALLNYALIRGSSARGRNGVFVTGMTLLFTLGPFVLFCLFLVFHWLVSKVG